LNNSENIAGTPAFRSRVALLGRVWHSYSRSTRLIETLNRKYIQGTGPLRLSADGREWGSVGFVARFPIRPRPAHPDPCTYRPHRNRLPSLSLCLLSRSRSCSFSGPQSEAGRACRVGSERATWWRLERSRESHPREGAADLSHAFVAHDNMVALFAAGGHRDSTCKTPGNTSQLVVLSGG
jgi:hypothetical protein